MSFRLPFLRLLMMRTGAAVFALSYRGYGLSSGRPSERGLALDAEAGLAHLRSVPQLAHRPVLVFGRSLGGAVALHLAAAHQGQLAGLVLENTFTCVEDMVQRVVPLLGAVIGAGKPLNFLVTNKWHSLGTIARLDALPLLMMTSLQDEMVPPAQMRALHAAAAAVNPRVRWVDFPSAHHMDAYDAEPARYWQALKAFVDDCTAVDARQTASGGVVTDDARCPPQTTGQS